MTLIALSSIHLQIAHLDILYIETLGFLCICLSELNKVV